MPPVSTYYMQILADADPSPATVDNQNRVLYVFNARATAVGATVSLAEDCLHLCAQAGLLASGVLTDSLPATDPVLPPAFVGPLSTIPRSDGPIVVFVPSGGQRPLETHDGLEMHRPAVQIVVRAIDHQASAALSRSIWQVVHGLRSTTVVRPD